MQKVAITSGDFKMTLSSFQSLDADAEQVCPMLGTEGYWLDRCVADWTAGVLRTGQVCYWLCCRWTTHLASTQTLSWTRRLRRRSSWTRCISLTSALLTAGNVSRKRNVKWRSDSSRSRTAKTQSKGLDVLDVLLVDLCVCTHTHTHTCTHMRTHTHTFFNRKIDTRLKVLLSYSLFVLLQNHFTKSQTDLG